MLMNVVAVIVLLVTLISAAPTQPPIVSIQERLKISFKNIDTDSNGIASFREFQVLLKSFDANRNLKFLYHIESRPAVFVEDGNVTLKEYAAAVNADVAVMAPVFHAIDRNHNNSLDEVDLKYAVNNFDSDNNGEVTQDEFVYEYANFLQKLMNFNQSTVSPTGAV